MRNTLCNALFKPTVYFTSNYIYWNLTLWLSFHILIKIVKNNSFNGLEDGGRETLNDNRVIIIIIIYSCTFEFVVWKIFTFWLTFYYIISASAQQLENLFNPWLRSLDSRLHTVKCSVFYHQVLSAPIHVSIIIYYYHIQIIPCIYRSVLPDFDVIAQTSSSFL
jgi:hypothetical protein